MGYNPIPGIETIQENMNPILSSPNSEFSIGFYQTRDSLMDIDTYRVFLKNCETRFRRSATYSNYKGFLINLGMDRCQFHGFINTDMNGVDIEMHHAILTLFDICLLITEHLLNTVGYVSTFDVVQLLKEEHKANNIALVMLSLTPHQLYHDNTSQFFIHPKMCFGNWPALIEKYKLGLTQDVAFKLLHYLKKAIEADGSDDNGLLDLREKIKEWSQNIC
jgi:hypothetical protein